MPCMTNQKFSCIRINIRKCSRSASSNANRRSTTREMQWQIAGFTNESFQGANHRLLLMPPSILAKLIILYFLSGILNK
jgi:hypothetical protein